jgi:hypothetical protein
MWFAATISRDRVLLGTADQPGARYGIQFERTTMQQLRPAVPPRLNSPQVLFRAILRLVLLSAFAAFGSQGFSQTFASLLALAAIFCAIVAAMRGEAIFGRVLTHWDEAATYAVLGRLVAVSA